MTNTRTLIIRNKREGWYHGCEETHRRVPHLFSLRNRKYRRIYYSVKEMFEELERS
jgi:hypothetical protein